jgi:hypothetical protein
LIGALFVALGAVLLAYSESVVELSERYDSRITIGNADFISFKVASAMTAPVFIYYELTNFYQNHRRYVASRDDGQLSEGNGIETGAGAYSSNCSPWSESRYTSEGDKKNTSYQLYPCGLVARSVFNDTFTASVQRADRQSREVLSIDTSPGTISWKEDVEVKFHQADPKFVPSGSSRPLIESVDMWLLKTFPPQVCLPVSPNVPPRRIPVASRKLSSGMSVVDCDFTLSTPTCKFESPCIGDFAPQTNAGGFGINNAQFINWMRTAGLSSFRKLYGRIDQNLNEGDVLYIGVQSNFPVQSYGGTKSVVLSTATWAGGKNSFLGITYIVVGGLCIIFTIVYAILHFRKPTRLIDIDYLDWGESH